MTPRYIDISPPISSETAVFPGDTPFSRRVTRDFRQGNNVLLSEVKTTLHIGAHADAPNHYHPEGVPIDQRELHYYIGPVQVIEVFKERGEQIVPGDFEDTPVRAPRVLFKTNSFPDPDCWNSDFNVFSPECIRFLGEQQVILVGIDTPSFDFDDTGKLLAHNQAYRHNMAILEGIILSHVTPGCYQLIALPLNIKGADASPVRAILVQEEE